MVMRRVVTRVMRVLADSIMRNHRNTYMRSPVRRANLFLVSLGPVTQLRASTGLLYLNVSVPGLCRLRRRLRDQLLLCLELSRLHRLMRMDPGRRLRLCCPCRSM
jgi:hypothetical protein